MTKNEEAQAVEMTVEDAEKTVVRILRTEAEKVVAQLGWGGEREEKAVYISSDPEQRLKAAQGHRARVDAFNLSDNALLLAWGLILTAELTVEMVAQVVDFALAQVKPETPVERPQSLIPTLQEWYPKQVALFVSKPRIGFIGPPLAKALLFKSLSLEEATRETMKEALTTWLETGFVELIDGSIKYHRGGAKRTFKSSFPLSKAQQALVKQLFPTGRISISEKDGPSRSRTLSRIVERSGMGGADLVCLFGEVNDSYSQRKYATTEGLLQLLRRQELLGFSVPPSVEQVVETATESFFETLRRGLRKNWKAFLVPLRQICDVGSFGPEERQQLTEALWTHVEEEDDWTLRRTLHGELYIVEGLFEESDQPQQIRILVERYLAEGAYLYQLREFAETYSFDDLLPKIEAASEERDARAKAKKGAEEREEAKAKEATKREWIDTLQTAIQMLETTPGAGNFLLEAWPEHPPAGRPGCVIATSVTLNLGLGSAAEAILRTLRGFRDSVIADLPKGQTLIDHYERTAPPVADLAKRSRMVRASFWWTLIRPSVALLRRRPHNWLGRVVDGIVTAIFLAGLAWTTLLNRFTKE